MKFLLPLLLLPAFAACTPGGASKDELKVAILNAPKSLASWRIRDGVSTFVGHQIHRGLVDVSEKVEKQPDGRSVVFRLRRDLKFHDGTPLSCAEAKSWLERLVTPEMRKETAAQLPPGTAFECLDERSLKLKVSAPALPALLLQTLTSPSLSLARGDGRVGIGPYRIASEAPGEILLERHHGEGPKRLRFTIMSIDDAITRFREGELDDLLYVGLFHNLANRLDLPCEKLSGQATTVFWLNINSRSWAFSNVETRRDLMALAANALAETRLFEGETETATLIPVGVPGYRLAEPSKPGGTSVVEAARRRLLALVAKHGKIRVTLRNANRREYDWQAFLRGMDPKGDLLQAEFLENEPYFKKYYAGELSVAYQGANAVWGDPFEILNFFRTDDRVNSAGVKDPEVDRLSEAAARAATAGEVERLALQANDWILRQAYALPLISKRFSGCVKQGWKGYDLPSVGPLLLDYSRVHR